MAHSEYEQVMTRRNLREYMKWRKKPWKVDDLLYERLPMLAVRNYLSNADDAEDWPLCWTRGRSIRLGLSVCTEALKSWGVFRTVQPGVAEATRKNLQACVPQIVGRLQTWLRDHEVYRLRDASDPTTKGTLLRMMARSVAEVSGCKRAKKPNPMLGSKVLHFFFPEFFPVWDTAWIKKTIKGLSERGERRAETRKFIGRYAPAAHEYARYLDLMFDDLKRTRDKDVKKLKRTLVSFSAKRNRHESLGDIVDDNLWDLSPILFELCLMGRGRACGVL